MKVDDTVEPGQIKALHPARVLLRGAATMLDFAGVLAHRPQTQSVNDDLAIAWQEVLGVWRPPPATHPEDAAPAAGGGSDAPETETASQPLPHVVGAASGDEQGLLFGEEPPPSFDDVGYRGPTACVAAGITYRQLDYFARTNLVEPSIRPASGSGQRLYGFRDILTLKVIKRLLDTGISLQQIRVAVDYLRDQGAGDITQVTLMSDGVSVYASTSPDDVVDLLQGGQGVFGVALGQAWREVEGTLADLPQELPKFAQPDQPEEIYELAERMRL
jgi:DNA-binding transcriptional MerR regulator